MSVSQEIHTAAHVEHADLANLVTVEHADLANLITYPFAHLKDSDIAD